MENKDVGRDFTTALLEGQATENLVKRVFTNAGYEVIDRQDDMEYQHRDIDFEAVSPDTGALVSFEVKSDNRISQTNNVAVEYEMYRYTKVSKGWYHYCEADYIIYCDATNRTAYFICWKKLKPVLITNLYRWRKVIFNNGLDGGKGVVQLVNIEDLKNEGYVQFITDY